MGPPREEAEEVRLLQVHQYLSLNHNGRNDRKPLLETSASGRTSPNTALTAFAQLVALRLGAQRAIISLVDRNHQYFLAESTRNLDFSETGEGDWLWMGCSGSTHRDEALCAQTIKAPLPAKGYPCFCIPDLLKDVNYRGYSYVKAGPQFRFYAGTPLISREGFRIGSLFIIDDRSRDKCLDESEIAFLGTMAKNVMEYLDMQRESEERKRISLMSKGLAAFTEGRHRIPGEWKTSQLKDTGTSDVHATNIDLRRRSTGIEADQIEPINKTVGNTTIEHKPISSSRVTDLNGEPQTHTSILARASNLLRESLDVDYTVFLSAKRKKSSLTKNVEGSMTEIVPGKIPSQLNGIPKSKHKAADVLSFSTTSSSSSSGGELPSTEFSIMRLSMVKRMVKKHPNGHLWTFDEKGAVVQVEDEPFNLKSESNSSGISSDSEAEDGSSQETEFEVLRTCFPGVRQMLYAPITDPATSNCIAACFAVSLREVPVFNTDIEVAFARAFLNNVAVEWDRITVSIADRQKGDFLSSISHEFRSPLHGILASTELLSDSDLNPSQRGLCDTVLSCGSTLLNTVSHVLDWSKINDFHHRISEKQDRVHSFNGKEVITSSKNATRIETLPSFGLYSNVDVASICEAVVQTVCAGFMHDQKFLGSLVPSALGKVTVILDISFGDWMFECSAGAIQRILMNLVGNALKYTKTGWVRVELELDNSHNKLGSRAGESQSLKIVVSDTGIGISEDFLRHKLFVPFSQESTLAPGTGLGLSMVRKIVHGLQGEITVHSQQNQGTQVVIHIPLVRAANVSASSPTTFGNVDTTKNPISVLRENCSRKMIALYGSPPSLLRHSIEMYITQWYCFDVVEDFKIADLIIVDENDLDSLASQLRKLHLSSRVIVLRSASAKEVDDSIETDAVLKPIGPFRLAKTLLNSWTWKQNGSEPSDGHQLENTKPTHRPNAPEHLLDLPKMPVNNGLTTEVLGIPKDNALPLRVNGESTEQRTIHKQMPANLSFSLPQPTILIVDDNPINLKLLQAYLKKLGYEKVIVAEDGLEAFNVAEREVIDLIFMDISMPVCDGHESTKRIRKFEKQRNKQEDTSSPMIKPSFIIALTGQASTRDRDEAFASGMDYFATKPLNLGQLKRLMAEWELKGSIDPHQSP